MIHYNSTKGRAAVKRYAEKIMASKPPKPPKQPKPLCKCGATYFSKGLCKSCYYNERNKRIAHKTIKNHDDFSVFNSVFELVKNGNTIDSACKALGINRGAFYYRITIDQKNQIRGYKALSKFKYKSLSDNNDEFED
jgi:hypothetical protein